MLTKENGRIPVFKVVLEGQGFERESGQLTPNADGNIGNIVYVRDPDGVGARGEEFTGQRFSSCDI